MTTSESLLFQLQHDAGSETFKAFTKEIREVKEGTKEALRVLVGSGGVVEAKL